MVNKKPPVVLTVAGFDPSGGAGVLADIKTMAAFGCYGVAAISAITFQNTFGVSGTHTESPVTVRRQIASLLDDFDIAAIKTGMLPTDEIVQEVVGLIRERAVPIVVVDPVLRSTSGFELANKAAVNTLVAELLPLASLTTPNRVEAELISGVRIEERSQAERAAETILGMGARAVLITGGDTDSDLSTDLLVDKEGSTLFTSEHIKSRNTHGTGCTLASALTCLVVQGHSLRDAIPRAKDYIRLAILSAPDVGRGNGPMNHLPPDFE